MKIPVDRIIVTKDNPRQTFGEEGLRQLGESIKTHGQLQAIIVRPKGSLYELVVGERRLRACALGGLTEIEAEVRNVDDSMAMELRLIENTQREDLSDAEKGDAVLSLWALGKYETLKDVANAIKISYDLIKGKWIPKARKLSEKVKEGIVRGTLTERAAEYLLKYPHTIQEKLAKAIIDYNIRGGRGGAEREFLKLYDQNPDKPLEDLANEALGIEKKKVLVPESMLSPELQKKIEEQRQLAKVHRVRSKPSKRITKEQVREKLGKKTDFKFDKVKVVRGSGKAKPLPPVIKPNILGTTKTEPQPDWTQCKCPTCPLFGAHCRGRTEQ